MGYYVVFCGLGLALVLVALVTEPWQWLGRRLCVDHHFADALVEGMEAAGLDVQPH